MLLITISIVAQGSPLDGDILSFECAPSISIADLKGFVQAQTNFTSESQRLYHNNSPLQEDSKTLEEAGLKNGDMVALVVAAGQERAGAQAQQAPNGSRQSRPQQSSDGIGSNRQIEDTRLRIIGDERTMSQLREQRPALAAAVTDSARFREVWMEMMREEEVTQRARDRELVALNEDMFSIEAQTKIAEMIRQETVQENLHFAYEHNPEVFARVTMLYVPVEVNKHPVKAFVDSGAQTTIMSPSCAEACGILRLIDKRYSGVAKGVGTAQILGRVHSADIRVGNSTMPCSFTVMEGKDVDLLLGLDMLKRFQAVIDLKRNKLVFGDANEVDFLGEADIPKSMEEAMESEPTISGPNGTEIGAQSGTVRPAGTSAAAAAAAASSTASGSGTSASGKANSGQAFKGEGRTLGDGAASSSSSSNPSLTGPVRSQPAAAAAHSEEKISQLMALGVSRQEVIAALDACGGDAEVAGSLFFGS